MCRKLPTGLTGGESGYVIGDSEGFMEHRLALVILNMLPGVGPVRKRLLESALGSAEAAFGVSEGSLARIPGIGERAASAVAHWRDHCDPDDELRLASRCGVRLVLEEDSEYPPLLREIHDPPICLYVRGDSRALAGTERSVAVVGSRNCTGYGRRMAGRLAFEAGGFCWPVISGLARGIDTEAHEGTLRAGGCTVAVIGCGLSCIYPQENIPLAMRIGDSGGAVVSEFPMRCRADRRTFPMRNRIISGIAAGTIVVEAGLKSGSLITASQALEQNRTVFAVPGPADSFASQGCNALIRDGAVLITCFRDVVDEFSGLPGLARTGSAPPRAASPMPSRPVSLDGLEKKLWELIRGGCTDMDALIAASGEDPACVSAAFLTLELKRLVRRMPGRRLMVLPEATGHGA